MLTKNYYRALAKLTVYGYGTVSYIGITGTKHTVGAYVNYIQFGYNSNSSKSYAPHMCSLQTTMGGYGGVIIGTGTTPPTVDDISLSGDIISNFTYISTLENAADENGLTLTANYTITNTGTEAFTIGEVAIIASLTGGETAAANKALLERTVLETPITIEAGGVGQLTYTVRLNYPTA